VDDGLFWVLVGIAPIFVDLGLSDAGRSFAVGVGTHVLGLCTNGVFDRFPDVKVA
jgi:hypothetical protein